MNSTTQTEDRKAFIESLGLIIQSTFVPRSQSRNKAEEDPSLNWLVTLSKGKKAMTIEYMKGMGHIPGYRQTWGKLSYDQQRQQDSYKLTCETGKLYRLMVNMDIYLPTDKRVPDPTLEEVLYCVALDSAVLNYSSYEEWAHEFGYEEDSRKGEQTYQACIKQALQLKALIGMPAIEQLRELYQDY